MFQQEMYLGFFKLLHMTNMGQKKCIPFNKIFLNCKDIRTGFGPTLVGTDWNMSCRKNRGLRV